MRVWKRFKTAWVPCFMCADSIYILYYYYIFLQTELRVNPGLAPIIPYILPCAVHGCIQMLE